MEKCNKTDRLYNPVTKRCYKSCEQKKKVTHPITKKCRQPCKNDKTRRIADFRCVKKNQDEKKKRTSQKKVKVQVKTPEKVQVKTPEKVNTPVEKKEEELIPPKLQTELKVNLQMFNKWMSKGIEKGNIPTIDYMASDITGDIIQIYFAKKYKQNCPIYPINVSEIEKIEEIKKFYKKNEFYYKKVNMNFENFLDYTRKTNPREWEEWNIDKFLNDIKLCLETGEKLMIIPLRLKSHLNMLFIKAKTREIIRFEPHGSVYRDGPTLEEDDKINKFLEELTSKINKYLELAPTRAFKYVTPYNSCPRKVGQTFYKGFQAFDYSEKIFKNGEVDPTESAEGQGFCLLWSWFFAECVINNPDIPIKKLYIEAHKSLKEHPLKIATIIRGYFLSVNDELKEMKEKHNSITGKYVNQNIIRPMRDEQSRSNHFLLDYLLENKGKLQQKTRRKFVGGVKHNIPAFKLPKANPRVKPVKFLTN
jgi:hypothetical protein